MNKKPPYEVNFSTLLELLNQYNEVAFGQVGHTTRGPGYAKEMEAVLLDFIDNELGVLLGEIKQRIEFLDTEL